MSLKNSQKLHLFIDWFIIIIFLGVILGTTTKHALWEKTFRYGPVFIFLALCLLFLNHISLKNCFQTKDKEFFLMSGGIFLSGVNMILVRSRIGAIFTIADFLLVLYLANKVFFNKIQLGVITFISFSVWFYWQFISQTNYSNTLHNPNVTSMFLFMHFCVFMCYLICFTSLRFQVPKWIYYFISFLLIMLLIMRILSFNCRGVFLGAIIWAVTFFLLPKKNYTVPLVIGTSLLIPALYIILWKSGTADGVSFLGKNVTSGRETIWYEFYKAFKNHPITGIGSDFDRMVPDLYLKEMHQSLLDLLFVHGIPVFLIAIYLLHQRIKDIINISSGFSRAVCLASIYGILTIGTFENYYIVPPYNIMLLVIFMIPHSSAQDQTLEFKS